MIARVASPASGRIAIASGLTVALVAGAIFLTSWSYRHAVDAHVLAADSLREKTFAQAAETNLWREREAMNEYLISPESSVLGEVQPQHAALRANLEKVGADDPNERPFVRRAAKAETPKQLAPAS
jgi:hypothetical protein